MSRRAFAAAFGATAAIAALPGIPAVAAPPNVTPITSDVEPDALGAVNPALTYLMLDAFAFFNDSTFGNTGRIYQDVTGVQPDIAANR